MFLAKVLDKFFRYLPVQQMGNKLIWDNEASSDRKSRLS